MQVTPSQGLLSFSCMPWSALLSLLNDALHLSYQVYPNVPTIIKSLRFPNCCSVEEENCEGNYNGDSGEGVEHFYNWWAEVDRFCPYSVHRDGAPCWYKSRSHPRKQETKVNKFE